MKKVVLFNPAGTHTELKLRHTPLSLLAVSRLLHEDGYDVKIISRYEKNYLEKLLKELDGAVCLGITSMTGYQIKNALDVATAVRSMHPDVKIVWGGWHPSILPEQTMQHELVDIVVCGQGERTFFELVEALRSGRPVKSVRGIYYKENGEIKNTPMRELESPDNFPPLPYELLDIDESYINSEGGPRSLYYVTSFGCPHRCAFCADKLVYKRSWKALPAKRVVGEIEQLVKKHSVTGLFLNDNNFFVDEKRVKEICKGLIKRNIKVKLVNANGRSDQLNRYSDETFALMEKSGFHSFLIGAESSNQGVLDYINKDEKADEMIRLVERCKKYNIRIYFSFVLGFPPKDREQRTNYSKFIDKEFHDTLDFIDKIRAIDPRHYCAIYLYTPYPGSDLFDADVRNGFVPPDSLEGWINIDMVHVNTPWLPRKYLGLTDQINILYAPFLSDIVYTIHKKSPLFRMLYKFAHLVLMARWKRRFFHAPIEYYLLRFLVKVKDA